MAERTCLECCEPIVGRARNAILCSEDCYRARTRDSDAALRARKRRADKVKLAREEAARLRDQTRTCVECGGTMAGLSARAVVCGKDCKLKRARESDSYKRASERAKSAAREAAARRREQRSFQCAQCGRHCVPGRNGVGSQASVYCSAKCKRANWFTNNPPPKASRRKLALKKIEKAAAGSSGKRVWLSGYCPRCGASVVRRNTGGANLAPGIYCSSACQRRDSAHRAKARRRMRESSTRMEPISRHRVFERDGFRCQLCNGKLAMSKSVPHPKAPTLDHIVPLSRGGEHVYANLQAAHFGCNCEKSDGGVDQLRLVG